MEEKRDKSRGELKITVEDTGGQVCLVKTKQVQGETQMQ